MSPFYFQLNLTMICGAIYPMSRYLPCNVQYRIKIVQERLTK